MSDSIIFIIIVIVCASIFLYTTYKPYIEEGKEKTKSAISKAKDKVSSWYKNYKESSD